MISLVKVGAYGIAAINKTREFRPFGPCLDRVGRGGNREKKRWCWGLRDTNMICSRVECLSERKKREKEDNNEITKIKYLLCRCDPCVILYIIS